MSEQLDLVSLCCRKAVDVNHCGYLCEGCGLNPCEAMRPDRWPKPFDPDRAQWVRKPVDAVAKAAVDSRDMSTWPKTPDNSPRGKQ